MLTRHQRGRDLPLRQKTNQHRPSSTSSTSAVTKLPSPAHHVRRSTRTKRPPAFLRDSSDEEESSDEEVNEIQPQPGRYLKDPISKSESAPSEDDQSSDESLCAYKYIPPPTGRGSKEQQVASLDEDSSSGEGHIAAPFPQTKKHVRFQNLNTESENESSDDANSAATGGDINLKCIKSITQAFPKSLQPPWNYRTSHDQLQKFMDMSHEEKWAARSAFQKMSSTAKQAFFLEIPGASCTCCQQPQRKDKGKKRGPNKTSKRRSKRVAGDEPSTNETSCEYLSLAHSEGRRKKAKKQKGRRWTKRSKKKLEYARSTQDQGSELSLAEVYKAVRATIRAATFTTLPPKKNAAGQLVYEQRKEIPRLRIGLIVVNEVQETRTTGGAVPADQLRRPKPQIHYVAACAEDLQAILETITLAAGDSENYDKTKFFGTGDEAIGNLNAFMKERKSTRSWKIASSKSLRDTQADISRDDAPSV